MTVSAFTRLFNNDFQYGTFEDVAFMDSLAYTVQEYLYSDKADDTQCGGDFDFRLDSVIKLFDFMSFQVYFIKALSSELWRSTISGYLEDISQLKAGCRENAILYRDEKSLLIYNASYELQFDLLWAAYIYYRTRYSLNSD